MALMAAYRANAWNVAADRRNSHSLPQPWLQQLPQQSLCLDYSSQDRARPSGQGRCAFRRNP
jgi:hypothetical protein